MEFARHFDFRRSGHRAFWHPVFHAILAHRVDAAIPREVVSLAKSSGAADAWSEWTQYVHKCPG